MSTTVSNVDLAQVGIWGNTGNIFQNIEPAIPKAVVLVPKGYTIPATAFTSQSAFLTYLNSSLHGPVADNRKNRWFFLENLDDFKEETKAQATLDTGLNQFMIQKFNPKYSFRYLSNKANHQELMKFQNSQNLYDVYIWDANTNIWGQADATTGGGGMTAYTLQQINVMDWKPADVKDMNQYYFSIQLKNRIETNENFAIWTTGVDSDNVAGLMNAVMTDVSSVLGTPLSIVTTTTVVAIMKAGQNSIDLAQYYQGVLTKDCFIATDLTSGATLTISTLTQGTIVVASQTYNYLTFVLSAAPTTGHLVQIALRAPSVVNAIIPNFNAVTEIVQVGVDSANACVHTF